MNIIIACIGKLRDANISSLMEPYIKQCGWHMEWREAVAKKNLSGDALKQAEANLLEQAIQGSTRLIALDERGKNLTSPSFAKQLSQWQDEGHQQLAFMIGGADGLHDSLRQRAHLTLSFGQLTWPHMLTRLMLAEQLYRAWSITKGHPYHRV